VAVCVLEESTLFNAGHGAFMNEKREAECDAMIMDGYNFKAGIGL
jgi:isoaspartyl peptidase/L-asparaginase-like protein (Ntn-hydrolase superfamily)